MSIKQLEKKRDELIEKRDNLLKSLDFTKEEIILYKVLKNNFGQSHPGLIIFQEDVMKICQECANFNLTEADHIRKAMASINEEALNKWKEPFINNWNQEGDPNKVWESLVNFAHYAFNKSHSVSYALVAYATAKIWTRHRNEFLEYCLNYGTKENYSQAMNKCKELKIPQIYPDIKNMDTKKFKFKTVETEWGDKRDKLVIPINAERNYDSYVEFLFDMENNQVANLIYKGVCDELTGDREALAMLATTTMAKAKRQAIFMEPKGVKFTRLEDILDGLKACGGLSHWETLENGDIFVQLIRARSTEPREITFHNNFSGNVRAQKVAYDLKMFGSIRDGVLSDRPYIETTMIKRYLQNMKDKMYEAGRGARAYYQMRNYLQDYMREYFSDDRRKKFYDIYALVNDTVTYSQSVKMFVEFNDCTDIFYIRGEMMDKVKRLGKNTLVKMTMEYSPYINKRKEEFIYDFDILELEKVE